MSAGGLLGSDALDRVGEEDLPAQRDAEFLAAALANQQRAAAGPGAVPGLCTSCGEPCHPAAVYCDEDCRVDHERVLAARRREGGG